MDVAFLPVAAPFSIPPTYKGPIHMVSDLHHRGGGRGYIASEDISTGTLLLSEDPFLLWPEKVGNDTLNIATLKTIYTHKNCKEILHELSFVHPVSLDIVPPSLVEALQAAHGPAIKRLSKTYKQSVDSILRLLLVLQCSSFSSGIYLHFSIFNHSCRPNAIKFQPDNSPSSQVRATQPIKRGEEVTISYIDPREQTYNYRARILKEQFGFDIAARDIKDDLLEKYISKSPAAGHLKLVEDLEDKLNDLTYKEEEEEGRMLQLLLDWKKKALEVVDLRHILVLRLNRMILKEVAPLLEEENNKNNRKDSKSEGEFIQNLLLFVKTAFEVYQTQILWLSKEHVDMATTYCDLSMGLDSLMCYEGSPLTKVEGGSKVSQLDGKKILYESFPQWNNFSKASTFQHFCAVQFEKIKRLYD